MTTDHQDCCLLNQSPEPIVIELHKLGQVVKIDIHVSKRSTEPLLDVSGHIDVAPEGDALLLW